MAISVQWGSLWNSTPPLLCTARGGKTNRSTCIKRSSQDCEAGRSASIVLKLFGNFRNQDSRPLWTLSSSFFFYYKSEGFFPSVCNTADFSLENHADTVSASLLGCVSHAVWIPRGRLHGDSPEELQLNQKLARCFGWQRCRQCQPEPPHITLWRHGTQTLRHLAGISRA